MSVINVDQSRIDNAQRILDTLNEYTFEEESPECLVFDRQGNLVQDDNFYTVEDIDEYFTCDVEKVTLNLAKFITRSPVNRYILADYYMLRDGRREYTFYVVQQHTNEADVMKYVQLQHPVGWYIKNGKVVDVGYGVWAAE